MASSPWLLRVVPSGSGGHWDVLQPRTGRTLDVAATQDLAVDRALERLPTGGTVEVVVDGFMVRREVVLPPPVPRRTAAADAAVPLVVGVLTVVLLGGLLHAGVIVTLLGGINVANVTRLVRQIRARRRSRTARPDPALVGARPHDQAS